eukprot:GHVS01064033.1.p1 GENE.GHVS01064033.1~~GHVS01064033.1.p1  ORF type:complete len:233 (+),score=81.75 GHVS01064033.1:213-911(+)
MSLILTRSLAVPSVPHLLRPSSLLSSSHLTSPRHNIPTQQHSNYITTAAKYITTAAKYITTATPAKYITTATTAKYITTATTAKYITTATPKKCAFASRSIVTNSCSSYGFPGISCIGSPCQQRRCVVTEVESVEQYRQKLLDAGADKLLVVQYTASWCGPCRQMRPIVTKWSNEMPTVEFVTVDIDDQSALAEEEDIKHVPTFVLLKNGRALEKLIGADATKMKEVIDKHK